MAFFHTLLAAFIFVSSNTAPPAKVVDETTLLKTCIYLNAQEVVIPKECEAPVIKLNICANMQQPPYECFALIGYRDERD
jgi:hypothetical protein